MENEIDVVLFWKNHPSEYINNIITALISYFDESGEFQTASALAELMAKDDRALIHEIVRVSRDATSPGGDFDKYATVFVLLNKVGLKDPKIIEEVYISLNS